MQRKDITIHQVPYAECRDYIQYYGLRSDMEHGGRHGLVFGFLEPFSYQTFAQALDAFSDDLRHIKTVHIQGTYHISESMRMYEENPRKYLAQMIGEAEDRGLMDILYRGSSQKIRFMRFDDRVACAAVHIGHRMNPVYNVLDKNGEKIIDGREVLGVLPISLSPQQLQQRTSLYRAA